MTKVGDRPSRVRLALAVTTAALCLATSSCALPSDRPGAADVGIPDSAFEPRGSADERYATGAEVLEAVRSAQTQQVLPDSVATTLTQYDVINLQPSYQCTPVVNDSDAIRFGECVYGDPNAEKSMVVYGDSHSDMWAATLMRVASDLGWKLRVFAKHACPAPDLHFRNPETQAPDEKCDVFHATAPAAVRALHPDLVVVTSISDWLLADSTSPTSTQWQEGWAATLSKLAGPTTRLAMLGDLPAWPQNGARCLAAHQNAVQECSAPLEKATPAGVAAEQSAATAAGAIYVPTIPWVCAENCEPVIADTRVFNDDTHLTESYAVYLTGALTEALKPVMTP